MEGGGHDAALADEHGIISCLASTSTAGPTDLDPRRPDEHAVERLVEAVDVEVGLEAVELAAVAVAPDGDVEGAEAALVGPAVEHLGGQQDHPGARAEHRHAVGRPGLDLVEQPARRQQVGHRRALAAGHDERVDARRGRRAGAPRAWRRRAQRARRWARNAPCSARTPIRCASKRLAARVPPGPQLERATGSPTPSATPPGGSGLTSRAPRSARRPRPSRCRSSACRGRG